MSGLAAKCDTHAERETRFRVEREGRLRQFIAENRPISAIAKLECLEFNYAKLLVKAIVATEGFDYQPERISKSGSQEIVGLTEETRHLRGQLGNALARLKDDPREVTLKTGVMFRSLKVARDKPNNFDWSLSQIERLARANDKTFRQLMLESLLTPDEKAKAIRCGIL